MKGFGSDNHSGVHPELFKALSDCNIDHAPSYGTDDWSERAKLKFQNVFGKTAQVYFVFNGTAANVVALRAIMKNHEAVLCGDLSHLNVDECGAPEFFAGKLMPLPTTNGKLSLETLKRALIRRGDQHFAQPRVVSLTQPTELGTCYTLAELKEIITWAHANKMFVHIDGARLANAVYSLKTTYQNMCTNLGVDIVSFGGTKNGLLMGEAIVVLNPQFGDDLKYLRKQSAQLPSKTRFIAAQFERYLEGDLYLKIAEHSCQMAQFLESELKKISQIKITQPCESNAVFAIIPQPWIKILREKFFFYVWDEHTFECRLMTSWDTTKSEITEFVDLIKGL